MERERGVIMEESLLSLQIKELETCDVDNSKILSMIYNFVS